MKLLAEGAKVVGVSRTKANLDETLAQVKAAGGDGRIVAADLSRRTERSRRLPKRSQPSDGSTFW